MPSIAPDDHPGAGQTAIGEHLCHRPGGAQHHSDVHCVRSAAHRATQPRSAERQRVGEPLAQFVGATRGELGGRLRVGVVHDPLFGRHFF